MTDALRWMIARLRARRHGEILTPDGRYWPDRESAEDALDAAWSAWRERYRASRGVAPDDGRRHNLLVALTPSLLARIEALGFEVGSEGVLPWLVGKAEEMRAECDVFATYRGATTTALGIEPSSCAEDVAEAVNEMRLALASEQGRQKECLNMLDHLIAHVEDHGEDAASDSVYEDLLRLRAAMLAADKAMETT